jgi:hypothetical protein
MSIGSSTCGQGSDTSDTSRPLVPEPIAIVVDLNLPALTDIDQEAPWGQKGCPSMEAMERKRPRPRRAFTPGFKADIVERCLAGDRSIGQVVKGASCTHPYPCPTPAPSSTPATRTPPTWPRLALPAVLTWPTWRAARAPCTI